MGSRQLGADGRRNCPGLSDRRQLLPTPALKRSAHTCAASVRRLASVGCGWLDEDEVAYLDTAGLAVEQSAVRLREPDK